MQISSDVIAGMLSRSVTFRRLGSPTTFNGLPFPKLASPHTFDPHGAFVVRGEDAPPLLSPKSMAICVGDLPQDVVIPRQCDVIVIGGEHSVDEVFNTLQGYVGQIANWLMDITEMATRGADVREMLKRSIPIFENAMNITDYGLRILACCTVDHTHNPPTIFMDESNERIPVDMTRNYIGLISGNMAKREPFFFDDPMGHNFCVNLFEDDVYIGCCSLSNHAREIEGFETLLFQMFAAQVRLSLIAQGGTPREQIPTLTSVFSRLVRREQVPRSQVEQALGMMQRRFGRTGNGSWRCVVIRNANHDKDMPEGYVVDSIREMLPTSHAFSHEKDIVAFVQVGADDDGASRLHRRIEPFLKDMNFRAGVSRAFEDVFSSFKHYRQAVCALESEQASTEGGLLRPFDDIVFDYMLGRSMGEFDPEDIVAPELFKLAALGPGDIGLEYIDTLRAYLDNNCNGLQTSKATYLHRSTLAQRIERIRTFVDLDSPRNRLYLQLCLHLPGVRWGKLT